MHELICIECPMGCAIEAETKEGTVTVRGYGCARGKKYAESEVTCPMRVITSTVRSTCGRMIPVKTSKPVRKSQMFAVMQTINATYPELPLALGDVLVHGIDGDADLVVTGSGAQ